MRSAFCTAEMRWLTSTSVCRPWRARSLCRICRSVAVSTAESASSKTRIGGSCNSARAIAVRCFCPPLRVMPRSPTFDSKPSGKSWMLSSKSASRAASSMRSSEASVSPKAMLPATVSLNRNTSCCTKPTLRRSVLTGTSRASRPSMRTRPSDGSSRRGIISTRVDLPAPVRPTTPSISPASSSKRTSFKTHGARSSPLPARPLASTAGRFCAGPPSALPLAAPSAPAWPFSKAVPSSSRSASSSVGAPVASDISGALSEASPWATAPSPEGAACPFSPPRPSTTSSSERCP